MERLKALGRGTQMMLVAGVLLLVVTFLPWQEFDISAIAKALDIEDEVVTFNAWDGFWGWMLGLLTVALLVWIVVRLAVAAVPVPVWTAVAGVVGTLVLFFAVVKNVVDNNSTIWAYVGVGLAAVAAAGAWLQIQDAGDTGQPESEQPSSPEVLAESAPTPGEPPTEREPT